MIATSAVTPSLHTSTHGESSTVSTPPLSHLTPIKTASIAMSGMQLSSSSALQLQPTPITDLIKENTLTESLNTPTLQTQTHSIPTVETLISESPVTSK